MKHVKEILIGALAGLIIGVLLLTVNYYSNQEKDAHYAEIYGIQNERVENNE